MATGYEYAAMDLGYWDDVIGDGESEQLDIEHEQSGVTDLDALRIIC